MEKKSKNRRYWLYSQTLKQVYTLNNKFPHSRKISIFFFAILLGCSYFSHAQNQEIKIYKTFGGVRFEMDTLTLSTKQVLNILSVDPVAYDEFKRAKRKDNISGILGFSGAFLIAFPIGTAIAGGEPEWWLAAGGGGLILASIPFNRAFKSHAVDALDLYNKRFAYRIKPDLYFTGTQLKLVLRF